MTLAHGIESLGPAAANGDQQAAAIIKLLEAALVLRGGVDIPLPPQQATEVLAPNENAVPSATLPSQMAYTVLRGSIKPPEEDPVIVDASQLDREALNSARLQDRLQSITTPYTNKIKARLPKIDYGSLSRRQLKRLERGSHNLQYEYVQWDGGSEAIPEGTLSHDYSLRYKQLNDRQQIIDLTIQTTFDSVLNHSSDSEVNVMCDENGIAALRLRRMRGRNSVRLNNAPALVRDSFTAITQDASGFGAQIKVGVASQKPTLAFEIPTYQTVNTDTDVYSLRYTFNPDTNSFDRTCDIPLNKPLALPETITTDEYCDIVARLLHLFIPTEELPH